MKIPFTRPDINEDDINRVAEVLRSGWITTGPVTKEFERQLALFCGTEKAVCLASQTISAELVLRYLGIGEGDEVIVPAYTYTASASVICHVGAVPVMIDSCGSSPEMDYEKMEAAINRKTKAVIPVDLGGVPCDYEKIFDILDRKKSLFTPKNEIQRNFGRLIVLADTAHSLGAEYKGKKAGNLADFSAFSLHAIKNLTTAEGGFVTWRKRDFLDSEELYRTFMLLSLHGQTKDALNKNKSGQWEYDIVDPLYKANMTDIAAALGLSQLGRYAHMLARRKELIENYDRALLTSSNLSSLRHYFGDVKSSGHLYLLRNSDWDELKRNSAIEKMGDMDISCNVHYKPLPMLSAYKKRGFDIKDYPNAYSYYKNLISLPLYSLMTDEEQSFVIEGMKKVLTR